MHAIEVTGHRVRPLLVPLRRPLATSVGTFTHGPFLAVEIATKGGISGRVIGFGFNKLALHLVPPLIDDLVVFAKSRGALTLHDLPAFFDAAQKRHVLIGHEGLTALALSMLDMALHDALGQHAGLPLYKLLGATSADIPAYNSCGLGLVAPDAAAREAKVLAAEHGGFAHVKMRLGRRSVADDVAAIQAVKDAIGPNVQLSVDWNQALRSEDALAACRAIDEMDLHWIEEPVTYDDYEMQARLADVLATFVSIGESWWHWRVAERAMAMNACDYAMPDVLRIGGVTGWMRTARAAERFNMQLSSHLSPEYSAHLLAASPTRHWLEYMDWAQELLRDPLVPQHGKVRPSEVAGVGHAWDEAAIERCVVAA